MLILTAAVLFCGGCKKKQQAEVKQQPPIPVKYSVVTQGEITQKLELSCNIKAEKTAVLMSAVPGKIIKVYRREGESVAQDEPLVDVNPEEIQLAKQQAEAGLSAAQATEAQAKVQTSVTKADYERYSALKEKNAISQSDFDKAQGAYDAAQEAVKMAEAGVSNAKALVDRADIYQRDTTIMAPFPGELVKLLVEEGERIQTMPPTPIGVLMDYSRVKIECYVAERDIGSVTEGASGYVFMDAYPNTSIEISIERIVPYLDPQSRTFTIETILDNADHHFKPGMMARLQLTATYSDVITVPRDAFSLNNITGEIRIVEILDGVAKERKAIAGRSFGDRLEITDLAGLQVGSIVITSGASDIMDGQKVELAAAEGEDLMLQPTGTSTSEVETWGETTREATTESTTEATTESTAGSTSESGGDQSTSENGLEEGSTPEAEPEATKEKKHK